MTALLLFCVRRQMDSNGFNFKGAVPSQSKVGHWRRKRARRKMDVMQMVSLHLNHRHYEITSCSLVFFVTKHCDRDENFTTVISQVAKCYILKAKHTVPSDFLVFISSPSWSEAGIVGRGLWCKEVICIIQVNYTGTVYSTETKSEWPLFAWIIHCNDLMYSQTQENL